MIRLDKGQLSPAALLGLSKVALPCDLIVLVLMIENVARMDIIFHDDLPAAVLKKFFPGGRDDLGLFRCLKGCDRREYTWAHVHIVEAED